MCGKNTFKNAIFFSGGLSQTECVYVLQGDIEGVNSEPNDRKVSGANSQGAGLNQIHSTTQTLLAFKEWL